MGRTRTGGPGRGFTLIELLVVIAVIALLMAVLLPVLERVRKQAQAVVCQAKLRQWGIAFSAYVGDHDGKMPRLTFSGYIAQSTIWFLSLKAYIIDYEDMLLCPTARIPFPTNTGRPSDRAWHYHRADVPDIVGSYGDNRRLGKHSYNWVAGHAGIPVLFDCANYHVDPRHDHEPPEYEGHY